MIRHPFADSPRLRITLLALVLSLATAGCGREGTPRPARPPEPDGSGHARMVAFLARLASRAAEDNPFLGDRQAKELTDELVRLPADADPFLRLRLNYEVGTAELRLGETRSAIDRFRTAYDLIPELGDRLNDEQRNLTVFQLAVAYLRLGETENCVRAESPEACLLPIHGGGLHTDREGSSRAIPYLEQVLEGAEPDGRLHLTARWLLNVAHMTLGTWPEGVPDRWVIPPSAFASAAPFPRFPNVARDAGLDSFHLAGGACIEDFDGDLDLDVLISTWDTAGQMRYFRNEGDGSFTDRTEEAHLTGLLSGLNMTHADYDNDGDTDVYVMRGAWLGAGGRHPNSLLRNDGGRFEDVTFSVGLGDFHYPGQSASWGDYDNDGDLDLYVAAESSQDFDPEQLRSIGYETVLGIRAPGQLFRNEGDGTFTERAAEAGLLNERFAKAAVWGDVDGDRYPDLFVSNYAGANRLYRNNRDGTFTDIAAEAGVERPLLSFPAWLFDYDNDGALDVFCSSYSGSVAAVAAHCLGLPRLYEPPLLGHGDGRGHFRDVTEAAGLMYPMLPMGANFGDLNGDGYPEIYLGTGSPSYANLMPNVLFLNRRGRGFADVTTAADVGNLQKGHGVAFADIDQDGDVDLFEQMGGAYPGDAFRDALYENPGFGTHTLTVRLVGTRSNRSAIGARLCARIDDGGERRAVYRHVNSGGSFGAGPLRQTLGLGQAASIDTLEVYWPTTDETQRFFDVAADRAIRIVEGEDVITPLPLAPIRLGGAAGR